MHKTVKQQDILQFWQRAQVFDDSFYYLAKFERIISTTNRCQKMVIPKSETIFCLRQFFLILVNVKFVTTDLWRDYMTILTTFLVLGLCHTSLPSAPSS